MGLKLLAGLAAIATTAHAGTAAGRLAARTAQLAHDRTVPQVEGWVRADRFLVSASAFVTILILARYLDLATLGAFMLAYTALLLFMELQKALVSEPHRALGAALPEAERRRHTGSAAVMQGLGSLALCAVLCVAGGMTAALYSPPAGDVLIALAVTAVPWLAQDFLRRALHARGRSRDAAINSAVTQGLQIFGAVVLCATAASWATPVSALSVLALSALVGAIVGIWQLQPLVDFDRAGEGQYQRAWTDAWRHGRALTAQNGLAWLGSQGPSWIVALLLGIEQLGVYRAVAHLAHAADPFFQAGRGLGGAMTVLLYSLAPFVAVLVLFPDAVLERVYGDKFTGAGLASILVLAAAAQGLGYARIPLEPGLPARGLLACLLPAVLVGTLGMTLIHFMGVIGAPVAVFAANLALLLAAWVAHRRRAPGLTGP
jgi:O-antigen/teichoic acid export membrane protein